MKKIINLIKEYRFYIIVTLICILIYNIHLPYYVLTPGGTINLNKRIEVSTGETVEGSMNLLFVNQYNATIPTYLLSFVLKNWDLEKVEEQKINNETTEEIYKRNQIMLDNSIQNAIFVAYQHAGKKLTITNSTNYVIATTIDNNFKIGDIVTKVNNKKIDNIKDIKEIVKEHNIGDNLDFTIIRNNKELTIKNQVQEVNGEKIVGVAVLTNYEYTTTPELEFKFKSSESGSSGGLMLALTIYDLISAEDLAKGRNIAGTGTISEDGTVGEISGVKYKIMGAVKNKMDLILVPEENYEEAIQVKKDFNYDIEIISVNNFKEAINYLERN